MNRTAQFFIGLISLALAIGAGIYGRNAYLKDVSTIQIPVPAQNIAPYTRLTADLFALREVPRTLENMSYYQQVADLNGKISTSTLQAGLPVPQNDAVTPESFRLADAQYEVLSIPVEPVSAVGGQIHIGQRVNLYTMTEPDPSEQTNHPEYSSERQSPQVQQIAASVLVVDVRSSQGLSADSMEAQKQNGSTTSGNQQVEQTQILTLALPPEQVETVLMAVATAKKQGGLLWTTLATP